MNFKVAIVFLQMLTTSYGDFELACDPVNPSAQTDVTCVCRRTVGSGIKWFFNGSLISDCILNSVCLPQPIGYTFSINASEFAYKMTKSAYDYNDCTQIICTDASNTNTQRMVVPSAINFDQSNPPPISEPTLSHSNGNISISTGCISQYKNVTCKWYTVYNHGKPEEYTNGQFTFNENDESACSNCNNDVNAKKACGFYHMEASGNETRHVKFRVVVTHTPTNLKWEVNSANVYTVKDQISSISSNTTSATVIIPIKYGAGPCGTLCIVLICVGICLLLLVIIIYYCVQPKFTWIELEDKQIHLNWTDILNCCCKKIFEYNIVRNPIKGNVTNNYCRQQFTKEKYCTLTKLDPMAVYEISLCRTLCCFKSLATKRSVITRKSGMLNDQEYHAKSTSIDVRWTKPDCITNPQLKYKVTCNEEVKKGRYDQTNITLKDLIPGKMYKIEVFAIDEGTDILLLAKKIRTKPLNVILEVVGYEPGESSVKCRIKWTVENIDNPETLNASDNFLFNVLCFEEKEQIHKREKITDSSYTIPDLHPNRSYTVDVYAIYKSRPLEPHGKIQLTPYKPAWDSEPTPKSTEIELKWKKPEYTGDQPLKYEVTCNRKKVAKTSKTSFTIEKLKPCEFYDVKIFTIINGKNGMKSLPLQRTIRTQPCFPPIENVQHGGNHHPPNNAVDTV